KDDAIIQQNTIENNTFLGKVEQKNITFDNLKTDTKLYQIFEQTLYNSKNETAKKLSNRSKTISNSSQFSSNVTKSTLGNYTAYTIPVKNTTGDLSSFQNIVIEADNVREAGYLITYYPDENYQEFIRLGYIRDGANIDFSGSSKIEILYYKGKMPNVSKVSSTNKSNQSKGSLSQKSNGDVTCYISCFIVHTPSHNCTRGGNHTPEQINECNPNASGNPPSAGEIQAYCFEYGCTSGGRPSGGSDNGSSPEGATTGGPSPFRPVLTPDDWIPENICIETDPITGSCTKTEPYNPIISRPEISIDEDNEDSFFDEQIFIDEDFKDNPCLKSIYDDMGKASTIKGYLQNFDPNFTNPVANLRLSVGVHPIYPNATAVTDEPDNYLITITFNPNKLSRPKLDVANTMIHEIIHAEMYRKLLEVAQQPNIPWTEAFIHTLRNNYEGLADYYTRYWLDLPLDQQPGDPQHEQMAEHFINIIVQALKDVDNSLSDLQYRAIAWTGLKGGTTLSSTTGLPLNGNSTVAWENVPLAERLLLNTTYANYRTTNSNCQ
ncbi:hypothetical protein N9887_00005, partial [Flavobacteriaceae bacterium]|nr:hypothetical protein [Flavobacteriaceae bacterium]